MFGPIKSAIDMVMQGQGSRLVGLAESYKQRALNEVDSYKRRTFEEVDSYKRRTLHEVKETAISVGVTIALILTGVAFLLVGVTIGLAALFYWVSLWHGTLAGLGAAGGVATLLALILIVVAVSRSGSSRSPKPYVSPPLPAAAPISVAPSYTASSSTASGMGISDDRAAELGRKSVDAATGIMRDGSREAVIATLAATVILGVLVGRRGKI